MNLTITINMDKKCAECGKGGAVDSGICIGCTSKALSGRVMKSPTGKAVQRRFFTRKSNIKKKDIVREANDRGDHQ
jgi:uncharacterized membrane protein YvbJ